MNLHSELEIQFNWLLSHSRPALLLGLLVLLGQWLFRRQLNRRWHIALGGMALFVVLILAVAALTDVFSRNPASRLAYPKGHKHTTAHAFGGLELTGRVTTKGGGALPGPALVFIASATPKNGVDTVGPTAWDDCVKQAQTDAKGGFKFTGLDPNLVFQIRATAKGFQCKTVDRVDPAKGRTVKLALDPVQAVDATPDHTLSGRVIDTQGKPIAGALAEVEGMESKDGGASYGRFDGIDREAVTGTDGTFLLTDKKPFDRMMVKVSAPWYADKIFDQLASGTPHDLVLTEGAEIHGRVRLNGHALAGVSVGLSGVNRAMGAYLGHFDIGTDAQGNFDFGNLPPDADFKIYTLMRTMKNSGAVSARTIHTGRDGETTEVGDLAVEPGHRLAGRVVVADDQPVPSDTHLNLGREAAWDNLQITLGKNGGFDVPGIPSEIIDLGVRPKGYHLSARNLSLDQMNPFRLIGRVDHDITNLVIRLESGPEIRPDYRHMDPDYNELRNRPLAGAEAGEDHSREWSVSGHVVDGDTKAPVQNFRVTPGQTDDFNRTAWKTVAAVNGTNGGYQTFFSKRAAQPLLKVEAQGYLPQSLPLASQDSSNVDFILQKGSGPSGSVVTADGKPEAGAILMLLTDDLNQAFLNSSGTLSAYGDKSAEQTADAQGFFAFKPVLGMKSLAAASADGFALVNLEAFASYQTIRLEPFGKITGVLNRASGPGTNEQLDIVFGDRGGQAPVGINLANSSTTDAQGRFEFNHVPPGAMRITYREMMGHGNNGWMNQPLQEVDLKPGQMLAVNITAPDLVATETANTFQPPPGSKPIPGKKVAGVVLLPNGRPAADADVALQVEGKYLSLGRGTFQDGGQRNEGLIVSTGPDGGFSLPLYEGAQSVIALNLEGYVQVSLDQLKQSPRITLQKWGRIEGTLRVNHHPGTNEVVVLGAPSRTRWMARRLHVPGQTNDLAVTNASQAMLMPPMYNSPAFQAKTDDQGRFVITFVPPGEQIINRRIPLGGGGWTQNPVATVEVPPGETLVTNVGGTGRTVIGRVKFSGDAPLDFKSAFARIATPSDRYMDKFNALKTDAERQAFSQSDEAAAAMKDYKNFAVILQPDGSFRAEDVQPGAYEFNLQPRMMPGARDFTNYTSVLELAVPAAKDESDEAVVDWGGVEMTNRTVSMPAARPGAGSNRPAK